MLAGELYSNINPGLSITYMFFTRAETFFSPHETDTAPHPPFLLVTLRMSKVRMSRPQLLAISWMAIFAAVVRIIWWLNYSSFYAPFFHLVLAQQIVRRDEALTLTLRKCLRARADRLHDWTLSGKLLQGWVINDIQYKPSETNECK